MTNCKSEQRYLNLQFTGRGSRKVQAAFSGGTMSSDAGLMLVRELDRRLNLTQAVAGSLVDARQSHKVRHDLSALLRQRVYAIVAGYEDLNDHQRLREDRLLQLGAGKDRTLASSATLCRIENRMDRQAAWAAQAVMVEQFIASFAAPPEELVLDFDATDDPVHGRQEGRFFHGYYDHYCFLPLYVFCGSQLLCAYLRPSNIDAARHAGAVLKALVTRVRAAWPGVRLIVRADSGFCRRRLLGWCERNAVNYVIGLARNSRLVNEPAVLDLTERLRRQFEQSSTKQRGHDEFLYAARTWKQPRRVITRIEWDGSDNNPRFVLTNLQGSTPADLYDRLYCARGEMENRIKEAQLGLFADRTSCHRFAANQWRLILASLAYILVERLRAIALKNTELACAQAQSIRVKLIKIAALITENTRRIVIALPRACPYQAAFAQALANIRSP